MQKHVQKLVQLWPKARAKTDANARAKAVWAHCRTIAYMVSSMPRRSWDGVAVVILCIRAKARAKAGDDQPSLMWSETVP